MTNSGEDYPTAEKVTQRARDAAAGYMEAAGWGGCSIVDTRTGHADQISDVYDSEPKLIQAFARFEREVAQEAERTAMERAGEWLRMQIANPNAKGWADCMVAELLEESGLPGPVSRLRHAFIATESTEKANG